MNPKCYAYARFSTAKQSIGTSIERQESLAKDYAEKHGYDLKLIKDHGKSAYHSDNLNHELGNFIKRIEKKEIPPDSIFLLENLDRLSRDKLSKSISLFTQIISSGIKIADLSNNKLYSDESGIDDFIVSLTTLWRGHNESKSKEDRLKRTWELKRKNINDKKLTSICPAWLKLNKKRNEFEVIEERKNIIDRIFELSLSGYGFEKIAQTLNEESIPSFTGGNGWHKSYIQKIIHGKSVIGEYTPHLKQNKKRIPLEPIPNYFPQVVSQSLYNAVHERLKNIKNNSGGRNGNISNLFGLIGKCVYCRGSMRFINKGKPPKGGKYLVCDNAYRKISCYKIPMRYNEIELKFLQYTTEISASDILDDEIKEKNDSKTRKLRIELDKILNNIEKCKSNIDKYKKFILSTDDNRVFEDINKELIALKDKQEQLNKDKNTIESEIRRILNSTNDIKKRLHSMQKLIERISNDDHKELRLKLRNEIRKIIDVIYFSPKDNIHIIGFRNNAWKILKVDES